MFIEIDEKYHSGFEVVEYKEKWSLIAAREYKEKIYQKWGEIETGKDTSKRLPVSVEIGKNKAEAIKTLEDVIHYLKGKLPEKEEPFYPDGEIPF
jgi:hypothetical protein